MRDLVRRIITNVYDGKMPRQYDDMMQYVTSWLIGPLANDAFNQKKPIYHKIVQSIMLSLYTSRHTL